jgi:hypothetical protein
MVTVRTAQKLAGINFETKRFVGVVQFHKYFKGQCACGKAISTGCLLVDIEDQGYSAVRKNKDGEEYDVTCYTSGIYVGTECIKHVAGSMSDELKKAMNEHKRTLQNEVDTDPETCKQRGDTMTVYYALSNFLRALRQANASEVLAQHNIDPKLVLYACNGMERTRWNIPTKPANTDTAQGAYAQANAEFKRIAQPFILDGLVAFVVSKNTSRSDKEKFQAEILAARN